MIYGFVLWWGFLLYSFRICSLVRFVVVCGVLCIMFLSFNDSFLAVCNSRWVYYVFRGYSGFLSGFVLLYCILLFFGDFALGEAGRPSLTYFVCCCFYVYWLVCCGLGVFK